MTPTILTQIVDAKRRRVEDAKSKVSFRQIKKLAETTRSSREPHRLLDALSNKDRVNIIAEFKRASPSKGLLNDSREPAETTRQYVDGGAVAISVLTEQDYFMGSLDDLTEVRNAVECPVLRKDFVVDEYQIFESAAAGADAILLIASVLPAERMKELADVTSHLGLDVIVEVHDAAELETAAKIGASIIGVNNRNLRTFNVSLDVSRTLIEQRPTNTAMIAESGIRTATEIAELWGLGFDGFLIGETLMAGRDPTEELRKLQCGGPG